MHVDLDQIAAALAAYASGSRLYALTLGDGSGLELLVEAFAADDSVNGVGERDVIALSTLACIDLASLVGQPASLQVSLADGTRTQFGGDVIAARVLGSDGGFTRYALRIAPWPWQLGQVRNSRVWQVRTVIEIVDEVLEPYRPRALWRWSDETAPFMREAGARSYCCQYRESDLAFVSRLLAEEGISWRMEDTEHGPVMVLFADSREDCAIPEDAGSEVRFHRAGASESQDAVQALGATRALGASAVTVLSYDYKTKKAVHGSAPSNLPRSARLPPMESFDVPGQYAYANRALAQRVARIRIEAVEARSQLWQGRSTVRTLRAGARVCISDLPLRDLAPSRFTTLRVWSVGFNNLPAKAQQGLAELFGPIPELLEQVTRTAGIVDAGLVIEQAVNTGYANCFDAVAGEVVWRPHAEAHPTAFGTQSAIVIGADGNDLPHGADELHCDRLGRVRIRYHWQDGADATCWVRVAQRSAGGGMGSQFLPRIGQEVLVQFIENDIDRPVIVGALYNGQGEGGIAPTPGGQPAEDRNDGVFAAARDHMPSAQGNLVGGHSPVWHGASAGSDGHRNGGAQWGVRSKEFGGRGYNQLLFDDTDGQGRIQLKSTHAASELNLGHLIHAADNYRGSFRGLGAELRTDAYGAVRAGAGLLVSSYGIEHAAAGRDPAGDNAPAIAMLKQAVTMAKTFGEAAGTHQTVALAGQPVQALLTAVSGMVDGADAAVAKADAREKNTKPADGKLPHTTDPIIAIAAKAGLGVVAGQSVQLANGETVSVFSGMDTQFVSGRQMRWHTGQAIGVLGGAMKPGANNIGLQMIAADGAIDLQAQSDTLTVQARNDVNLVSASAHIDFAAAKKISLSTAGGANITIEGGNITVQCPGKLTINAGTKIFSGPEKFFYPLPALPRSICVDCLLKARGAGSPFILR